MPAIQNATSSPFSASIPPNEVFKYVRQNIKHNSDEYLPQKVKSRSKKLFLSFRDEDNWKTAMHRRSRQKECGFFAKCDSPYRDCGNVILSTKNLVLDSLENIGNHFTDKRVGSKHGEEYDNDEKKNNVVNKNDNYSSASLSRNDCLRTDSNNGMLSIKECLEKVERRIISVKAGQPLCAYIRKEKEEQELRQQNQEKDNVSRDMLLIDPMDKGNVGIPMEIDGYSSTEKPVECRRKLEFHAKLDALLLLFNTLQNMRLRDLKTKTPLSVETLNVLRKIPCNDPLQASRMSRRSIQVSAAQHREQLEAGRTIRLIPPALNETSPSRIDVGTPPTNTTRKRNLQQQRHKNSPAVSNKVETWDDLLSLEISHVRENSITQDLDTRDTSRMGINTKNFRRRNNPWQVKTAAESLPLWQKITQDQRDNNDKEIQNARSLSNELKSKKHDDILENLKSGFEKTKQNNVKKIKEELGNRVDACRKQFNSLKLGYLREKDFKNMRSKVNEWRHDVNMSMARPPVWLEELKSEQKNGQLHEDEQTNEKLEQLSKFVELKPTSINQAKLCLLVFSLPVYELCTIPMQEAVKFFTCNILELTEDHLNDWLHGRKLIAKNEIKES